jgi:hypothetical protein
MISLEDLSTVEEYATMCGVTVPTIYKRYRKKYLTAIKIDGLLFIDSKASPPCKFVNYHYKVKPQNVVLADDINPNDLVAVYKYASDYNMRPDLFYIMALRGKIKYWIIGDIVFILRQDARQVPLRRKRVSRNG